MLIVAALVRVRMGSPVLFRHKRPGKDGVPFVMLKFRTMGEVTGADAETLSDGDRLTRLGSFLRRTSIDELPELWNVLKGEMSIVGPRPLLMGYLPLYTERQARRSEVRPGVTGWAQVNGRNAISWEEKFELDVWYVDNQSFWLDIKILGLTVVAVLGRKGISQQDHATMEYFTGTKHENRHLR